MKATRKISNRLSAGCFLLRGTAETSTCHDRKECEIYEQELMSYNLYLEMKVSDDIDLRVQNVENFYYWYSSILLPYNRVFLKEKWNSLE